MMHSIKNVFSYIGEAFIFYKEQFNRIMLIVLTIVVPCELFLLFIHQFSLINLQIDSLYIMVFPIVFSIAQLPLVYLSVLFIRDEIVETIDIYRIFLNKLSYAYITSLFFLVPMVMFEFFSDYLWFVGVFLSISVPYIIILKEYHPILYITKSVKFGLLKWLQLLILLSSFYIINLVIQNGFSMGIDILIKDNVPSLFTIIFRMILEVLLVPLGVFVLTRCYYNWLEGE